MVKTILEGIGRGKRTVLFFALVAVGLAVLGTQVINAKSYVYADADAKGKMDGSADHPFKSIQDAINKSADKDTDVLVLEGFYKENLELWSDIKLIGEKRGKVVIEAEDDDEHTIIMFDDSEIHNLHLTKGRSGVYVKSGSKALISNCNIVDNEKDGIKAGDAKTRNDQKLEVYDSYIAKNGRNGIYVQERKFYLEGNLIEDNDHDGIELAKGVEGIVKKGRVKDNGGDGIRVFIDRSEITIDDVTLRDNKREGIEVRAEGEEGFVHIEDCKFNDNKKWAIARIEARPFSDQQWNRSLLIEKPEFIENGFGAISDFIAVGYKK